MTHMQKKIPCNLCVWHKEMELRHSFSSSNQLIAVEPCYNEVALAMKISSLYLTFVVSIHGDISEKKCDQVYAKETQTECFWWANKVSPADFDCSMAASCTVPIQAVGTTIRYYALLLEHNRVIGVIVLNQHMGLSTASRCCQTFYIHRVPHVNPHSAATAINPACTSDLTLNRR